MHEASSSNAGYFTTPFEPVTHQDNTSENRQLFFAKVSKAAGEDEIKQLFSEYGSVQDVIIFQSSQGSATSKGCGLVTMSNHAEAASAIQGLHGKYSWSNRDPPMVVTWMDAALQDPSRQQHLQAAKMGAPKNPGKLDVASSLEQAGSGDTPPVGCEQDAVKLFVGNLPLHYTEDQVLPVFKSFGTVVELVIVRNKQSSQSKGCAFVWYATRAQAEAAVNNLNLKHVLPDVTGQQHRPLVVRKARTGHMHNTIGSKPSSSLGSFTETVDDFSPHTSLGARLLQQQQQYLGTVSMSSHSQLSTASSAALISRLGSGTMVTNLTPASVGQVLSSSSTLLSQHVPRPVLSAPVLTTATPIHPTTFAYQSQAYNSMQTAPSNFSVLGMHYAMQQGSMVGDSVDVQPITVHTLPPGTYVTTTSGGSAALQGLPAGQAGQAAQYQLVMDMPPQAAYNLQHVVGVPNDGGMEQYIRVQPMQMSHAAAPAASMDRHAHGTVMALDAMQMSVVNDHLYVIQSSTGAQIMVSPGGPGTFNLLLSGNQAQLEHAQLMVASLLNQTGGM